MRTTLDINDALLARAKAAAAKEKSTLTRLIEEGLAIRLRGGPRRRGRRRFTLPVYRGRGGFVAGVVPTSNRSLYEAADDRS